MFHDVRRVRKVPKTLGKVEDKCRTELYEGNSRGDVNCFALSILTPTHLPVGDRQVRQFGLFGSTQDTTGCGALTTLDAIFPVNTSRKTWIDI